MLRVEQRRRPWIQGLQSQVVIWDSESTQKLIISSIFVFCIVAPFKKRDSWIFVLIIVEMFGMQIYAISRIFLWQFPSTLTCLRSKFWPTRIPTWNLQLYLQRQNWDAGGTQAAPYTTTSGVTLTGLGLVASGTKMTWSPNATRECVKRMWI